VLVVSLVDTAQDLALFDYMKCIHPETDMHSFVYFDGVYVGDGFRLLSDPGDWRCARHLGAAQARRPPPVVAIGGRVI
jgi:hypothetical protein